MILGKRCQALVTRPRGDAEALAAALAERGIETIVDPLIEIRYRRDTLVDLAGAQAVLCTSANGVRALAQASTARHPPLLAVGDATAARARAEGFADVASAGGAVGDLVELAAAQLRPDGGRLVHVAGSEVAGDLAGALRRRGFAVDRVVLYDAVAASALGHASVDGFRARTIGYALFFSPRTAALFAGLATAAGIAAELDATTVVTISRAADAALAELPWRDRRIAAAPNQAALLATVDAVLAEAEPRAATPEAV
jgi:uroporphyrinogen-III synthase